MRQRAVDERDRQAQGMELIDLVFHQGDQRRDDQRQSVQDHGRQLIAEAFPPAGGHDAQAIAPGQYGRNHFFLPMPKRRQPKRRQMRFQIVGGQFGHRSTRKASRRTQVGDCPLRRQAGLHFGSIIIPPPLAWEGLAVVGKQRGKTFAKISLLPLFSSPGVHTCGIKTILNSYFLLSPRQGAAIRGLAHTPTIRPLKGTKRKREPEFLTSVPAGVNAWAREKGQGRTSSTLTSRSKMLRVATGWEGPDKRPVLPMRQPTRPFSILPIMPRQTSFSIFSDCKKTPAAIDIYTGGGSG